MSASDQGKQAGSAGGDDSQRAATLALRDEAATAALGAALAGALAPGLKCYLHGELGTGKTTLVRGLLRALGVEGRIKSPTYALVELYDISRLNLYHFDFYRLRDPEDWLDAGFREHFDGSGVCLVEWPDKAAGLPLPDLDIHLAPHDGARMARLRAHTGAGAACLAEALRKSSAGSS